MVRRAVLLEEGRAMIYTDFLTAALQPSVARRAELAP